MCINTRWCMGTPPRVYSTMTLVRIKRLLKMNEGVNILLTVFSFRRLGGGDTSIRQTSRMGSRVSPGNNSEWKSSSAQPDRHSEDYSCNSHGVKHLHVSHLESPCLFSTRSKTIMSDWLMSHHNHSPDSRSGIFSLLQALHYIKVLLELWMWTIKRTWDSAINSWPFHLLSRLYRFI